MDDMDDDEAVTRTPPATVTDKLSPRSTWRKRPSQKGKPALKLAKPAWQTTWTPKTTPPSVARQQKKKRNARDGAGERPPPVRRKLDLDGEPGMPTARTSASRRCFDRATLMGNLRSLVRLVLAGKPPCTSPAAPPKIDLRSFSRAQLMDNLRSLAKQHDLLPLAAAAAAAATLAAADEQGTKGKSKGKKPIRVDKLVIVRKKRVAAAAAAAAVAHEDPNPMALAIREEGSALAITPLAYEPTSELEARWTSDLVVLPEVRNQSRLVRSLTPAIEAAHNELMLQEETCIGENLEYIPGGPELDEQRQRLEARVDQFMEQVRAIIGERKFSDWKGSVVTSVVGTFLTQNVKDFTSSNCFMNIAAMFSFPNNGGSVAQSTNVELQLTDGSEQGKKGKSCDKKDKGIEELMASLRTGEIVDWDEGRIKKILRGRFAGGETATKIFNDIKSIREKDTSFWKHLREEAYKHGYRKEAAAEETIDWEAVMHASFAELSECIRDRGNYSQMVVKIVAFLSRIKRDHGSIDLEWLKFIPRAVAKRYLHSILGLGVKSVDCIRLLSLRHVAFPVDTNVARMVIRLGWVEIEPLPGSLEFHLVDKYPIMAAIQKVLESLLCKIPAKKLYELHCQLITFGKTICTKRQPNCGACPFTADCKYYQSQFKRAVLALPEYSQQGEEGQTNMDGRIQHTLVDMPSDEQTHQYQIEMRKGTERPSDVMFLNRAVLALPEYSPQGEKWQTNMDGREQHTLIGRPSHEQTHQYQIEIGKGMERHTPEPIIVLPATPLREYPESSELPTTPLHEYPESSSEEEYEQEYDDIGDIEDIVPNYEIVLHPKNTAENATHGTNMILIHPQASPIPMKRRYRLRTEYLAFKIPDEHEILDKFEPRVLGDRNPYLLIIRDYDYDANNVNATVLIPCRTATKGIFPLDGTYFQENEVFGDHASTCSPIQIKTEILRHFESCTVYFGKSIHAVTKGQTQQGIHQFYHEGYMCNREFDRSTRRPMALSAQMHATKVQKEINEERSMPDSSLNSGQLNDTVTAQNSGD